MTLTAAVLVTHPRHGQWVTTSPWSVAAGTYRPERGYALRPVLGWPVRFGFHILPVSAGQGAN